MRSPTGADDMHHCIASGGPDRSGFPQAAGSTAEASYVLGARDAATAWAWSDVGPGGATNSVRR